MLELLRNKIEEENKGKKWKFGGFEIEMLRLIPFCNQNLSDLGDLRARSVERA